MTFTPSNWELKSIATSELKSQRSPQPVNEDATLCSVTLTVHFVVNDRVRNYTGGVAVYV